MNTAQLMSLRELEGLRVGVARADGSRLDDCALLGVLGAKRALWVEANGSELLLPFEDLRDVWEVQPTRRGEPRRPCQQ